MHLALKTTAEIAVGNTLLVVVIGALAGYAFAWLDFPGRDWIFIVVIGLLVVPLQMALIPMFTLYDTLASSTRCSGSSSSTPRSGCRSRSSCCATSSSGSRRTSSSRRASTARRSSDLPRLILPLGLPAIASLAIFQFLWTWNDLIVALTFGQNVQPITVCDLRASCASSARTST